jgi:MFS-type transporter involved in bile tolerance (Atg22 family)
MISLIVPAANQGAAFGLIGCVISFALLIEPWMIGTLHDYTGSFKDSILVFIVIAALGALCSFMVLVLSAARHPALHNKGA